MSDERPVMCEDATNLATKVCEAAMDRAQEIATQSGVGVARMYIIVHLSGVADEDADTAASGGGTELEDVETVVRSRLLLELALSSAIALGGAMGYDVQLVPLKAH